MTVYFIRPVGQSGPVKIGFTDDLASRLRKLASDTPFPVEVAAECDGDETTERRFHALFYDLRSHGEWFRADPEIDDVVIAIRAGTFDVSSLPEPRSLPRKPHKKASLHRPFSATDLASALGISLPYASQVLRGIRNLTVENVAKLWKLRRWKLGLLLHATDEDCDALVRIVEANERATEARAA